jgi:hypothetical protein
MKDLMSCSQIQLVATMADAKNQLLFKCLILNVNYNEVTERLLLLLEGTMTHVAVTLAMATLAARKYALTVITDPDALANLTKFQC